MSVTPNQHDPAAVTAHGVANQGQIESPSETALASPTPGRSWRVRVPKASGPADSNGFCQAQIGPVSNGQTWFVEFLRIKNNSATATSVELFANEIGDLYSLDSSPTEGNDNWFSAPGSPGYWLGAGETMLVVWNSADLGSIGSVNAQVKVYG